MSTPAVLNTA